MFKQRVVLFEEGLFPRVYINPPNLEELRKKGRIMINPDMTQVRGVSQEYWKPNFEGNIMVRVTEKQSGKPRPAKPLKINVDYEALKSKQELLTKQVKSARILAIITPAVYMIYIELLHSGGIHACLQLIKSYFKQF